MFKKRAPFLIIKIDILKMFTIASLINCIILVHECISIISVNDNILNNNIIFINYIVYIINI